MPSDGTPATESIRIAVLQDPAARDIPLPEPATSGSAGLDLRAAVLRPVTIAPRDYALVPTGLRLAIPAGYEGQVRPRSGLAVKHGVTILNAPGTIDCDYRGELKVALINLGRDPYTINRGDRIAQIIIAPVSSVSWQPVSKLPGSTRGGAGFGHTGVH